MHRFSQERHTLLWQRAGETLRIEPWGGDSFRTRATRRNEVIDPPYSSLLPQEPCTPRIEIGDKEATIRNGKLLARVEYDTGRVHYTHAVTGADLLAEAWTHPGFPSLHQAARYFKPVSGSEFSRIEALFEAHDDERFYGLGQHRHGYLDQKGCVIPLYQRNTEVNIPFLVSSRNYGFLWNNSVLGRVELGRTVTRWAADASAQLDYRITAGDSYADIMHHYVDATGHSPMLPEWASGFWQCKLRYVTQEELLEVTREYKRRELPLSIIVVDFFHWTRQGEWAWDPEK